MEASWDRNWKDEVKISKIEARLGQRRQDRSKRSEEEARITKRRFERQVGHRFEAKRRQVREVGAEMGHVRGLGVKKKSKRPLLEAVLEPRWG